MNAIAAPVADAGFRHSQAAHCESGVISSLMRHHGVPAMTESMALGLSSGLSFAYLPFIKLSGLPLISSEKISGRPVRQISSRNRVQVRLVHLWMALQRCRAVRWPSRAFMARCLPVVLERGVDRAAQAVAAADGRADRDVLRV